MSKAYNRLRAIASINRRQFIKYGSMALGANILGACTSNSETVSSRNSKGDLERVTLGIGWYAEAEYGGFYQALATGIYEDYGLDVILRADGAQTNSTLLLMGGAIDFTLGGSIASIKAVEEGIPKIAIAAIFQKDPRVLIAHPNIGNDSLEKLKGKPIMVSPQVSMSYWPFLESQYGFTSDQRRPYNFDVRPFMVDRKAIQQGYLTSEPFAIEKQGGFKPVVMLLADYGYKPYSNIIETTIEMVEKKPDLVGRFVEASIKGWYSYLANPEAGNAAIQKENPDMTEEQMAYTIAKIKEYDIIISEDTDKLGIGAMTDKRWESFFRDMVRFGVFKENTNYKEGYTLEFVNKGVDYYQS